MLARILPALAVLTFASASGAEETEIVTPTLLSKAQIARSIFDQDGVIVEEGEGGAIRTEDVRAFLSSDEKLDIGMYRVTGKNRFEISDPYGVDEYMHFLEGGVTLTSVDGSVVEVKAGDSVIIPKEWKGVWESDGYVKIYIIYSPEAAGQ
jgi:uncharacterized cupin superfamily protein